METYPVEENMTVLISGKNNRREAQLRMNTKQIWISMHQINRHEIKKLALYYYFTLNKHTLILKQIIGSIYQHNGIN